MIQNILSNFFGGNPPSKEINSELPEFQQKDFQQFTGLEETEFTDAIFARRKIYERKKQVANKKTIQTKSDVEDLSDFDSILAVKNVKAKIAEINEVLHKRLSDSKKINDRNKVQDEEKSSNTHSVDITEAATADDIYRALAKSELNRAHAKNATLNILVKQLIARTNYFAETYSQAAELQDKIKYNINITKFVWYSLAAILAFSLVFIFTWRLLSPFNIAYFFVALLFTLTSFVAAAQRIRPKSKKEGEKTKEQMSVTSLFSFSSIIALWMGIVLSFALVYLNADYIHELNANFWAYGGLLAALFTTVWVAFPHHWLWTQRFYNTALQAHATYHNHQKARQQLDKNLPNRLQSLNDRYEHLKEAIAQEDFLTDWGTHRVHSKLQGLKLRYERVLARMRYLFDLVWSMDRKKDKFSEETQAIHTKIISEEPITTKDNKRVIETNRGEKQIDLVEELIKEKPKEINGHHHPTADKTGIFPETEGKKDKELEEDGDEGKDFK